VEEGEATVKLTEHSLRIAAAARHYIDVRPPRPWRDDCSGFVSAVMTRADVPMDGRVATIWASAERNDVLHWHPIPTIGDLAFFDHTHDRNGDGRWNDERTHIAVVVDVAPDGTITMAHNGSSGPPRLIAMNLLHPDDKEGPDGVRRNDHLRRRSNSSTYSFTFASALWSGFATVREASAWEGDYNTAASIR
jgi:hypothetical protein